MTPTLLTLLHRVDTPTVCNAIEVVQGKRGFDAFTRGTVLSSAPESGAIVGYARTAKLSAIVPSSEPVEVVRERRMAYYRYMAEAPNPSIVVIEDLDYPACIGAYWGEINTTVHKGFGIAGALTNGVMRDLGDLPDRFPVIAGSVGPSHGFVHLRDIDCPVTVFGMSVHPGDLIHADRHGAVVVPADVVPQLEAGIAKLMKTERIVLDAARRPDFDFDKFSEAWAEFERQRT
ncbi:acyl transferase [Paracoccus yeei]|uniref:Putative 4-hydroxy-4-methyl-2-oxoglutarate aldolase n=1 Tax=Paracoccus yeei TaxID=147645 RepID=A0A1V0GVA2_9RHOB|nr:RraA family protein [Paracoccus yeei]ARC37730.1 acyl transferase [Paracoccus yeei]